MAKDTQCPDCGEPIGQSATYCMHCSADLTGREPDESDETAAWADGEEQTDASAPDADGRLLTGRRSALGGLLALVGVGAGGRYLLQRQTGSPVDSVLGGGGGSGATGRDRTATGGGPTSGDGAGTSDDGPMQTSGQSALTSDVSGTAAPAYIESFEEGTLDDYEVSGGPAAVDSKHAYHGDGSLHLRTDGGPTQARTTGLESLPSVGETFRYRFYPTPVYGDGGANVTFALGENGRGYQILCSFWKDRFKLMRADGDSREPLAADEVSFEGDRWYTVEVAWKRDEIEVTLRADGDGTITELRGTDDTYSEGGLKLTAWANNYQLNVHYDAFETI